MRVDDSVDVRPGPVDLAGEEALAVVLLAAIRYRLAVEAEFADIAWRHDAGRDIARHDEALGILIVPRADMAEAVEDLVIEQDQIGERDIGDEIFRGGDEAGGFGFGGGFFLGWHDGARLGACRAPAN